jgi:hypothetical protein
MNQVAVTIARQHKTEINTRTLALLKQAEKIQTGPLPTNPRQQSPLERLPQASATTTATTLLTTKIAAASAAATNSLVIIQLTSFIEAGLNHQLSYLETGNIQEWQTFVSQYIQEFKQRNLDYNQIAKSSRYLLQALWEFFQQKLPATVGNTIEGVPTGQYLKNLKLRLDCLELVASTAGMALRASSTRCA